MNKTIVIKEYDPVYQEKIDLMMTGIQSEFKENITSRHSTVIANVYELPNQKYWVAFCGAEVAGTIGIVLFNNNAVVKRMMVDQKFRGSNLKTATILLDEALQWAKSNRAKEVFLGTMSQFIAAQKFYTKYGFKEIKIEELPAEYPQNPMDTLFYSKKI